MVNKYNSQLLFLIETRRKNNEMDFLRSKWKFDECFSVDCVGREGGLALLWRNDMIVEVLSYSRFHIDV